VIVYAIIASLLTAVLVLPSLLTLWDARERRRHGAPIEDEPAAEPASAAF
jgi:hypothetical protein